MNQRSLLRESNHWRSLIARTGKKLWRPHMWMALSCQKRRNRGSRRGASSNTISMVPKAISFRSNQENLRSLKSLILLMFNPENLNTQQTWALVKIRERPPKYSKYHCSQRKDSWKPNRRRISGETRRDNFTSKMTLSQLIAAKATLTLPTLKIATYRYFSLVNLSHFNKHQVCHRIKNWRHQLEMSWTIYLETWVCCSKIVSKDSSRLRSCARNTSSTI